ncbi:hypothetical protein [Xenorhabdus koppenhoeferi]|uniref:hypothetical protein n=1 Tax=Xenorhabdus koppenhoeferi TaxID=351659 RepID=UPI0038CD2D88
MPRSIPISVTFCMMAYPERKYPIKNIAHRVGETISLDKLATEYHCRKIDGLGDLLLFLDKYVDFPALADTANRITPRIISPKGGRFPFPIEVMVRIII